MQAFFSSDGSYALQFLVIFLVILVLFLIAALLFMRLSGRGLSLNPGQGQRGRQPRLGIVDIYELDRQRQLILLRRDNVEHLLLVGGPNDVVIERHIQRGVGSRYAPEAGSRSEIGSPDAGLMEPPRTDPFLDSPAPPTFSMPEVVPAAGSGTSLAPDRTPSLDPGLFEPEIAAAEARPPSPVSRLIRRTAPPIVGPRVETVSERVARPDPVPPPAAPEPPPVVASREPRAVDPAVLSDMARQLQVALTRPSSAVTLPPGRSGEALPPAPKPAETVTPAQPDPVAAAMASAPSAPPPKVVAPAPPEPVVTASRPEPATPPAAAVSPRSEPSRSDAPRSDPPKSEPPKAESPRPEPLQPEPRGPEPVKSEPAPAAPKTSEATATGGQNPFSVEEIEAEFARLLGRPLDSKG